MATITDDLVLNIAQPLRQFDALEQGLEESVTSARNLTTEMERTGSAAGTAARSAQDFETALREVEQSAGRLLTEVTSLELASGRSEVNFRELAAALNVSEDAARRVASETLEAQAAANRVGTAAAGIARQMGLSEDEAKRFTSALSRSKTEADDVAGATSRISTGFASLRSSALGLVAGFGAFAAIRSAVGFAGEARDAFAELQDSVNAIKVVFGEAAGPVLEFADTVAQTAGLSMAAFNQTASTLGSSLLNVGFGADEAARKTIELTQRAADMASIFGGPVSGAIEAILSALRGEGNPIERFGVTLTEAKVKAEAAALGFEALGGEFDPAAKAAARLNIIMEETSRTAGDFANTSGDLANASKIAAAEFENVKAELGEALLPVFQTLLEIAPKVTDALIDLAPSINALAIAGAGAADSTAGVIDLVDVLNLGADIPRGFGAVVDSVKFLAGVRVAGTGLLVSLFSGDPVAGFRQGVEGISDALTDMSQISLERLNIEGLIEDLRGGADAADTLANRLGEVGREGRLDPKFIQGLIAIAGTDVGQTTAALVGLINRADELGQSADDVEALRIVLGLLTDQGRPDGPIRSLSDRIREIPDGIPAVVGAMGDLQFAADGAGVELAEFALSTDPIAEKLFNLLDPADQLAIKLDAVRSGTITLADAFTSNLAPSIIDAADALIDFSENGNVSVEEFIRGLNEGVAESLAFKANLQTLFDIDPRAAAIVAVLPIEAAMQKARELVEDPLQIPLVIAAAQDIQGVAALQQAAILKVIEMVRDGVPEQTIADFITLSTDPETGFGPQFEDSLVAAWDFAVKGAQDRLIVPDFVPTLVKAVEAAESPLQTAAQDTIGFAFEGIDVSSQGAATRDTFADGITADIDSLKEQLVGPFEAMFGIDLFPEGAEARATFIDGLSTASGGETGQLQQSILQTVNGAIQRQSPPKLFTDAGVDSGKAFWSGFSSAKLSSDFAQIANRPVPAFAGQGTVSTPSSNVQNVNFNTNIHHPQTGQLRSDMALLRMLEGGVATELRSFGGGGF